MKPSKPPTLDRPRADFDVPEAALKRDKPESALLPCEPLDPLPMSLAGLPEQEQAKFLLQEDLEVINDYSECAIKQAVLADWINQE